MAKYKIVTGGSLSRVEGGGGKESKGGEREFYARGDEIELTDEEAKRMGVRVQPVGTVEAPKPEPKSTIDESKVTKDESEAHGIGTKTVTKTGTK